MNTQIILINKMDIQASSLLGASLQVVVELTFDLTATLVILSSEQ